MKTLSRSFVESKNKFTEEEQCSLIEDIIAEIDNINDRLDLDSDNRPLRLLGFKASFALINQIYTGLITIGLAMF